MLLDLPPLPPTFPYHTMYPHTATIALLALRPDNDYAPSFVIFGGTVGPGGGKGEGGAGGAVVGRGRVKGG